jgi:protein SCO1/2
VRRIAYLVAAAVALAAIATALWLRRATPTPVPPALAGIMLAEPRELSAVRLRDHRGAEFGIERLRGRWTLLFFGFTYCPDVCPTTMALLGQLQRELDRRGAPRPQVGLVTVDPARDAAEALGRYVAYFDPAFLGLRAEAPDLDPLVREVGAFYELQPPDPGGAYSVAHSASIFLIDPAARVVAAFPAPHTVPLLADRLAAVQASVGGR